VNEHVSQRILNEFASNLASAFEGTTGERPETALRVASAPESGALLRRQTFSGAAGALWIAAHEADWHTAGGVVLEAAGLGEAAAEKSKAEFLEIVHQTIAGLARAMSAWLGREVSPQDHSEEAAQGGLSWQAVEVKQGPVQFAVLAAIESELGEELARPEQALEPVQKPPTFDLLLDVELPISVSFGRAQVPLKDVLKLTTGSIVELNRAIGDPVEVIVNNCVIARGEVVTIEGNFGVRIQEVVSRQERWKTVG
jgi:flagellar motor switch protein FliN